MNFVFKIVGRAVGKTAFTALILACLLAPATARAQGVFFTTRELLTDFFKQSQKVGYRKIELTAPDRARIKAKLGYEPQKGSYTFFVAESNGKVDGYALIDEENGEHLPITFAVKLSPTGTVERQEIVEYREARGDEVRDLSFRKQFVGKTALDALCPERDIAVVSGATISSRAMTVGVKRALVLFDLFVRTATTVSSAARAPAAPGKL
jgi:electron transport complex protein RnfG